MFYAIMDGSIDPSAACCGHAGYVSHHIIERPTSVAVQMAKAVGRDGAIASLASLEIHMAKGQKRSNREVKKPKKTEAERAKSSATPVMAGLGKGAIAGQKRR